MDIREEDLLKVLREGYEDPDIEVAQKSWGWLMFGEVGLVCAIIETAKFPIANVAPDELVLVQDVMDDYDPAVAGLPGMRDFSTHVSLEAMLAYLKSFD